MVRVYSAEWLSNSVVRIDCKVTEHDMLLYSISCVFEDECVLQISSTVFTFSASVSIAHDIACCINRGTLIARKSASVDDFNDNPGLFE